MFGVIYVRADCSVCSQIASFWAETASCVLMLAVILLLHVTLGGVFHSPSLAHKEKVQG